MDVPQPPFSEDNHLGEEEKKAKNIEEWEKLDIANYKVLELGQVSSIGGQLLEQ